MPPATPLVGDVVEIACDESGFSGTNLLDPGSPVITHASVDLATGEASELIARLRSRFDFSPTELKSGQFRRGPGAPQALDWLLTALDGRARVHLVDKEFFLVTRIVDLLLVKPTYAAGTRLTQRHRPTAVSLYRAGRSAGPDWAVFLTAFVDLARTKRRRQQPAAEAVDGFLRARDALAGTGLEPQAAAVLDRLSRPRVRAIVDRLRAGDPAIPPPLEPLLPAVAETVLTWSDGHRRVLVVHDEQSALTAGRLGRLQRVLAVGAGPSPLAGLVMADSRDDPRVQVADLLAGMARRMPADGHAGPLRPFLTPTSLRDADG
ncbi:hypothetical protein Lfu02_03510 [Longispora fulva]|nr:hypothetical protein Lfu02_03510 [Longispora fulva]